MSDLTVIVVGAPRVAQGLESTGQMAAVHAVPDLNGLKALLQSSGMSRTVADKVFVVADTVPQGSGPSLAMFVPKLLTLGAQVMVLADTPLGASIASSAPAARVVSAPVYLNTLLGAIDGLPNVSGISAVPDAANILLFGGEEIAAPSHSPSFDAAPPAFDQGGQPTSPPVVSAAAAAAATPGFDAGADAPARRRRSLSDLQGGTPAPASNPFGATTPAYTQPANPAQVNQGPAWNQPPANPFGGGAPFATAPTQPGYPAGYEQAYPAQPGTGRRGFVITVTAPKGGTGKSSLSLNLAAYLGLRLRGTGRNVCLIDANVQQADSGKYLNAYTPNVEDVLRDPSSVSPERITNYLLHRPQLNLSVLLGPSTPDAANPTMFSGRRYSQILEALRPNFDYIIIDTPVAEFYHDMFRTFALPNADFILVAVTPNVTTLINTDMWLRQITAPGAAGGMGIPESRIGVVLNRAEKDIGFSEDEVRQNLAEWRYLGQIPETKEWKAANNRGELVVVGNYQELNSAFGHILSQVTGENLEESGGNSLGSGKGGGLRAIFKRKK